MMDAGVPIKRPVSGIAMGLIKDDDGVAVLSDITLAIWTLKWLGLSTALRRCKWTLKSPVSLKRL